MATETVYFNGIPYRRYPQSSSRDARLYFRRSAYKKFGGKTGFLHRDVWEYYKGLIPDGYEIHHAKGYDDNSIEALELLTPREHATRHKWGVSSERMAEIRLLAAKWHRSPEGLEWHKEHGRESWVDRKWFTRFCTMCGKQYQTAFPDRSKYCHLNCRAKAVRLRRKRQ